MGSYTSTLHNTQQHAQACLMLLLSKLICQAMHMAHGDHPQPPRESFSTLIHGIFPQKRNRKVQPGLVSTVEKEKRTREHGVTKDR